MSFAFLPLYTGDYIRDTQHLSCAEHGIYIKLLIHAWDQKGPCPLDERRLCGIVNARSGDEIEALRRVLNEFWIQMDDGWYNKRMQREIERADRISSVRSVAGQHGYQAKAKQLPKTYQAIAKQELSKSQASATTPTPTPTLTLTPKTTEKQRAKRATTLPEDFEVSKAVETWAASKRFGRLPEYLEFFKGRMRASGKTYVDWDQAFQNCIREDWPKLRQGYDSQAVLSEVMARIKE